MNTIKHFFMTTLHAALAILIGIMPCLVLYFVVAHLTYPAGAEGAIWWQEYLILPFMLGLFIFWVCWWTAKDINAYAGAVACPLGLILLIALPPLIMSIIYPPLTEELKLPELGQVFRLGIFVIIAALGGHAGTRTRQKAHQQRED